ncbi:Rpn family recombination-promoting nuclease/putative transposase [Kalamiella sp. sgz302252]|uniref:Rpn family recombination-promoting nuclease/putative transposase n=1 Tax=Pantoea sp. sgz302252 TaxID=3341827 RepID=UPI0036D22E53
MMKPMTPVPHDGLFKAFLTDPATARDFLTFHLPARLLETCDLSTLQLESGSFIEEDLSTYFADVLYSLQTSSGTGYIYTLIEHQSSPDKHMAFRLMRYAVAVMQRHLKAGHEELPLVIPLLFCHGRASPWPYTTDWTALFAEPELARQLYSSSFPLIDTGALDDDEIMQHRKMAMLELLLKHAHTRDLAELSKRLVALLFDGYTTGEQLVTLMNWMVQTGSAIKPEQLLQDLANCSSSQEEVLMTIAEYLEQKGRTQGEHEATLKIARALLQNGIDSATVLKTTGLSEQELVELQQAS